MKNLFNLIATCLLAVGLANAQMPEKANVIAGAERAFEKTAKTNAMPAPGCAVGVSLNGEPVFEKAFGLADMEHNIANTPQTIFESGSVAKQFTAAALILLQQDGKLNIDDPVRKYIPELPDYGKPLTIRHILTHTAGLRDWGSVMALTGVGRGDRVVTQAIALDVIYRQKHLDFEPGAEYSYSNSGYQLAAEIVERVSGKKFGDFVAERIFKPLGMTNSSWRDDYQKIVPGRAQAYSREGAGAPWRLEMPIMNVVGNGGMLTTVGDWLKWNSALDSASLGPAFFQTMQTQGVLNNGQPAGYALGLAIGQYKGLRDVSHGGSTAGYQTYLAHYPDQNLSIAVLCNGTSPSAGGLASSITDDIFGPFPKEQKPPETFSVSEEQLNRFVGLWRNERTHFPVRLTQDKGQLKFNASSLTPTSDHEFMLGTSRMTFQSDKAGRPIMADYRSANGNATSFVPEKSWTPKPSDLAAMSGEWYSGEAQAKASFVVENGKAFIVNKPVIKLELQPMYKDHFTGGGYVIWFTRKKNGLIERMHVGGGRMRDMFFERVKTSSAAR